jgi:ABC-type branched-subunit amino acid transport system substrate-binding protein
MSALRAIVAAVIAAVALAACASESGPSGPGKPFKTTDRVAHPAPSPVPPTEKLIERQPAQPGQQITVAPTPEAGGLARAALLLPLSGPSAAIGEALLNAAEMALFDIADNKLVLQVYDTKGQPEETAAATTKAIAEGAQIILGPVFAADARAAGAAALPSGVNIVSFSTDPTIAGQNVFVIGFLVQEQVREIVNFARSQGHTRFAVLAPDSAYGQAAVEALKATVAAGGGQVSQVGVYTANGANIDAIAKQITNFEQRKRALAVEKAKLAGKSDPASAQAFKALSQQDTFGDVDFDAILLPDQGTRLTRAATQLAYYDVDTSKVQMLGTLLWNTPNLGQEPAMIGGMYPAPSPEGNRQFTARYKELYGKTAPTIASHGYDVVALAAALARTGMAQPFSVQTLTSPAGFAGVDGIFRFRPDGQADRSFAIMQVTKDGPILVQGGATTFAGDGY